MLKSMMISCKKATFLISKREEHKLSLWGRMNLFMHLTMCEFCTRFSIQSKYISSHTHHLVSSSELSPEDKSGMIKSLETLSKE
jgi:hypothetical protein